MQIELNQVGGYAGTIQVKEVTTDDKTVISKIHQLVLQADNSKEEQLKEKEVGADLMQYEMKITEDGQTKVLAFTPSTEKNATADPLLQLYDLVKNL